MIFFKNKTTYYVIFSIIFIFVPSLAFAVYDLPNNDGDCPENCRQIPWIAGSDQWNNGSLPNYTPTTCMGLTEGDGTTNNAPAINNCIDNASAYTAVYIPAGTYYINGTITLKSNVVLRGAGAGMPWLPSDAPEATTLKLGSNGRINLANSTSRGSAQNIASGYTKGSKTLVMFSGHEFQTNDWIFLEERADSEIPVSAEGSIGTCTWCGDNDGKNFLGQFVKITNVTENTITLNRPLYYTFKAELSPIAKKIEFSTTAAGIEDLKIHGWADPSGPLITMNGALYCWIKNVETYNAGAGSKENHVNSQYSHGCEIRDSYFHKGRISSSDRNYGISFFFVNSDHKIENNILRHHRHSVNFEGGGSGIVFLYNYIDDNYTDDTSYLGSARLNHGAHPYMNLFEGNVISHIVADNYWGSSSHFTLFRNHLWGDETGDSVPEIPSVGFVALEIWNHQNYYSVVGNVLGVDGLHTNWNNATLRPDPANFSPWVGPNSPTVYGYGSSEASTTSINHGNHDMKTDGVAYWEGGADHNLKASMYYNSKPSFMNGYSWPLIGPDVSGYTNNNPAKDRYEGLVSPTDKDSIPAPQGFMILPY